MSTFWTFDIHCMYNNFCFLLNKDSGTGDTVCNWSPLSTGSDTKEPIVHSKAYTRGVLYNFFPLPPTIEKQRLGRRFQDFFWRTLAKPWKQSCCFFSVFFLCQSCPSVHLSVCLSVCLSVLLVLFGLVLWSSPYHLFGLWVRFFSNFESQNHSGHGWIRLQNESAQFWAALRGALQRIHLPVDPFSGSTVHTYGRRDPCWPATLSGRDWERPLRCIPDLSLGRYWNRGFTRGHLRCSISRWGRRGIRWKSILFCLFCFVL